LIVHHWLDTVLYKGTIRRRATLTSVISMTWACCGFRLSKADFKVSARYGMNKH
jgi:hypothetical protein